MMFASRSNHQVLLDSHYFFSFALVVVLCYLKVRQIQPPPYLQNFYICFESVCSTPKVFVTAMFINCIKQVNSNLYLQCLNPSQTIYTCSSTLWFHWATVGLVSRGWVKTLTCRLQVSLLCVVLCQNQNQVMSLQYLPMQVVLQPSSSFLVVWSTGAGRRK